MMESEKLAEYYSQYDEDGRLRSRHGMVEFETTMAYIQKYLRPGMRIMEIGAGTGRYSHALARKGWRVDAVELVEHNIELFKRQTEPGEPVTITQANALDLAAFGDESYDITLLLGPLYHLHTDAQREQAMEEALRVTKKGGLLFCAYCMGDATLLSYGFGRGLAGEIIEKCGMDPNTFAAFPKPWDLFSLYRKEDIDRLRARFPVCRLHFVAADGYANHIRQQLAEMDEQTYRLFLRYHLACCERSELLGLSHHTLDILRKE